MVALGGVAVSNERVPLQRLLVMARARHHDPQPRREPRFGPGMQPGGGERERGEAGLSARRERGERVLVVVRRLAEGVLIVWDAACLELGVGVGRPCLAVLVPVQGYLAHKKHPPVGPYSSPE